MISVTIGTNVTSIGNHAFYDCTNLISLYFEGNAPTADSTVFEGNNDNALTTYYLPGTSGWSLAFWGYPSSGPSAVLWNPQAQTGNANFGVVSNQFGFNITGNNNLVVVVEACTNLANPIWLPLATNTLTGGSSYFSDPQWTNFPNRYYGFGFP